MPAVFVHGNPETSAIWADLLAALRGREAGDLVTLSPPGFGAPVPAGFEATRLDYRDWLIGELEALGGGVDLVGHDWGGLHVYGVLAERPDLLRSWSADCAGLLHPDYVWHDMAQSWQTPEIGEQAVEAMFGAPAEQRVMLLSTLGIPPDVASEIVAMLRHEKRQRIELLLGNPEFRLTQILIQPFGGIQHFVIGIGFFLAGKDHIFFPVPYDDILDDNCHELISPVRGMPNSTTGCE